MYTANDGTIWYDIIDKEGNLVKNAEQAYNDFKDNKIDICPEPTTEEKVTQLMKQVSVMDLTIAELMLNI